MCCKGFWKRLISLALGLLLGLLAVNILLNENLSDEAQKNIKSADKIVTFEEDSKVIHCNRTTDNIYKRTESVTTFINNPETIQFAGIEPLRIISQGQAKYTNAARENKIQGNVVLDVTFLASGEIGNITVVSDLPYGLTKEAISAAKQIKFQPPSVHGMAETVTRTTIYTFKL